MAMAMAGACAVAVTAPHGPGEPNSLSPPRHSSFFGVRCCSAATRGSCRARSARRDPGETNAGVRRIPKDDSSYLWKLGLGSVGGAAAIKYGSVLLPDITRPNIVQALLMVSLPVVAAVFLLLKASSTED